MRDEFSVYVFTLDQHFPVARFVSVERAMHTARRAVGAAHLAGDDTDRIIVTDGGDHTVFEWQRGKGVTWPPEVAAPS